MAYTFTRDEQDTGFFSFNASNYQDSPAFISNNFYIAQGAVNDAKGLLTSSGFSADTDVYHMGSLNSGTYSVSASSGFWFFGSGYSNFVLPTVIVYDRFGSPIAGNKFSSNISFNVTTSADYYIAVTGSTFQSSQYSVSYTYAPPVNSQATSGTLAIAGSLIVGSSVSVGGVFVDLNGTNIANATNGFAYEWFVSADNVNWTSVSRNSSHTIREQDAGKYIDVLVSFIDDAGNFETVSPASLFIAKPPTSTSTPTYRLVSNQNSVNEGSTATFALTTTNLASGTSVPYTLTGVTAADVSGGVLSGNAVINSSGVATISVNLLNDALTEGSETLTVTAGGVNLSTVVNDTSLTPISTQPTTQTFQTTNAISISTGSPAVSSTANDLITGNTATNVVDAVAYKGSIKDYKVAMGSNGSYTVIDAVSSRDGSDVVVNVERLKFSPDPATGANHVALDLSPAQSSGQTALLIGAVLPGKLAFDASKQALLGSVIGLFDQGFTLAQLSGAILRLPIWDVLTGKAAPTNADIAGYLVNNVYGGTQTAAITNAAIAAMNAETPATQGNYLASLAASAASQNHIDLVGIQSTGLVYVG